MKKSIGIIGGIAPESTIVYYRLIIAAYRQRTADGSNPSIIINSIDLRTMLDLVEQGKLDAVADYMVTELGRLARAGANFAVLASNTPHLVFDEIQSRSPLPLISIIEAARGTAAKLGFRRLGLFGTGFTMQAGIYTEAFSRTGMTVVSPARAEQEYIHDRYMNELVPGVFLDATRARLLEIAQQMKAREQLDALILGGTELPLILRPEDAAAIELPFLDTCQTHVDAIIEEMLGNTA